jgi:hypothetical protein
MVNSPSFPRRREPKASAFSALRAPLDALVPRLRGDDGPPLDALGPRLRGDDGVPQL